MTLNKLSIELDNYEGFIDEDNLDVSDLLASEIDASGESDAASKVAPQMAVYKEKMATGEIIKIVFSQQERAKGIWKKDGKVEVILPFEELGEGNTYYLRKSGLMRLFSVVVYKVDETENKVYVSLKRAQERVRPKVIEQIELNLAKKTTFILPARVRKLIERNGGNDLLALDIMGLGINGVLHRDDWSHEYTVSLRKEVEVGDVIRIQVTGKRVNSVDNTVQYQCSRKATMTPHDKFADIETLFPLHSNVSVLCLKKLDGYFVGQIIGHEKWRTCNCYYPKDKEGIQIYEGASYRGYISHVSEEKKMLRVRVLERIPEKIAERLNAES